MHGQGQIHTLQRAEKVARETCFCGRLPEGSRWSPIRPASVSDLFDTTFVEKLCGPLILSRRAATAMSKTALCLVERIQPHPLGAIWEPSGHDARVVAGVGGQNSQCVLEPEISANHRLGRVYECAA